MSGTNEAQGTAWDSSVQIQESCSGKVVDELNDALTAAMVCNVETPYGPVPLANALASNDIDIFKAASIQLDKFRKKIEPLLMSDDRFPGEDNYILQSEVGRSGIYPNKSVEAMLYRAKRTGCTLDAIAWLRRVLAAENSNALLVETLWGLLIREPLQLTEKIQLLPIAELSDSAQKKFFVPGADRGFKCSWTVPPLISDSPGGVLVGQLKLNNCVRKYATGQQYWDEFIPDRRTITDLMEEFHDISMLMTLVGQRPIIGTAFWMEYEDPDLKYYSDFRSSWSARSIEVIPRGGQTYQPVDLTNIQEIISAFQRLDTKTKLNIRVALERFSLALRRSSLGDMAIDLSIALESLVGGIEPNEVTHKVTTRTARLLGKDSNQRGRIRDIIKATYHYRSAMVHNGHQPTKSRPILGSSSKAKDILDQACNICAELIKTILHDGSIPEWSDFDIAT